MVEKSILNQVSAIIGCPSSTLHLLGGYFDNVYEVSSAEPIVIKIYNKEAHQEKLIASEMEWVHYLQANDVNTVVPLRINSDSYIHPVSDNHYFVAFKKAEGTHVDTSDSQMWNSELFSNWGKGMAKMHSLAQSYQGIYQRPDWSEQEIFKMSLDHLDARVRNKWEKYCSELMTMSKSRTIYGIIHGDLHHHNFLVRNGELTFIDFGDSEYHWFAYDIAIAVYHAAQTVHDVNDRQVFAKKFLRSFMEGYSQYKSIDEIIPQIDYFINFRHLYSYVYHMQFSDKDKLNEHQLKYLDDMRISLVEKDSYLGVSLLDAEDYIL